MTLVPEISYGNLIRQQLYSTRLCVLIWQSIASRHCGHVPLSMVKHVFVLDCPYSHSFPCITGLLFPYSYPPPFTLEDNTSRLCSKDPSVTSHALLPPILHNWRYPTSPVTSNGHSVLQG